MFSKVNSAAVNGIEALIVNVEADVSEGLPVFNMVGFLSSEVKEAKDRVKTALKNSHFLLPPKHITINLSPADVRKAGTAFDLPIAIAIMAALEYVPIEKIKNALIAGELSLDGKINSVNGILSIVCTAKQMGYNVCIVPEDNMKEGSVVDGITVYGVSHISEVIEFMLGVGKLKETKVEINSLFINDGNMGGPDFSEIAGQKAARRAIEIAVNGQHNILLSGQPGAGKTMMARCIPSIMPPLSFAESLELSKIYSVSGRLDKEQVLVTHRPFRSPHHTITVNALTGGGRIPMPGEISLATNGVLFLDELPEFDRNAIEALRQPLEDKKVTISRLNAAYTYPAGFMLAASMNPCPCGFYPDRDRCRCSLSMIQRYRSKVSQPILDRIDLYIDVIPTEYKELESVTENEASVSIRERVLKVRNIQLERYSGSGIYFNSQLTPRLITKYCKTGSKVKKVLEEAFGRMRLSPRSYHRVLKVARTIADMDGTEQIKEEHIIEALCYRPIDVNN